MKPEAMESRASHALVGLFTLAVVATLLGFVFWFSSGRGGGQVEVRFIFTDRVTGLGRGSSVLFNGLRVGEVKQIALSPTNPREIYAVASVDPSTPLRVDTRARIEAQGLAGVVAVQLLGGEPGAAVLTTQPGQSLPTIRAEIPEGLLETVRIVAQRADEVLGGIEAMVKENAGSIGEGIRDAEQFSATLSGYSDTVTAAMQSLGAVADYMTPMTGKIGAFSDDLTRTVRAIDRTYVVSTVDKAERFAATLEGASSTVKTVLSDASSIAGKLNRTADQVEGVLKGAQVFLNTATGENGRNAFSEAGEAARNLRVLADNLDKSSAGITAEIVKFTAGGLRSFEPLINGGRRALTGVGRTLRQVDQDPQQLIFGTKPAVPPYNGSR